MPPRLRLSFPGPITPAKPAPREKWSRVFLVVAVSSAILAAALVAWPYLRPLLDRVFSSPGSSTRLGDLVIAARFTPEVDGLPVTLACSKETGDPFAALSGAPRRCLAHLGSTVELWPVLALGLDEPPAPGADSSWRAAVYLGVDDDRMAVWQAWGASLIRTDVVSRESCGIGGPAGTGGAEGLVLASSGDVWVKWAGAGLILYRYTPVSGIEKVTEAALPAGFRFSTGLAAVDDGARTLLVGSGEGAVVLRPAAAGSPIGRFRAEQVEQPGSPLDGGYLLDSSRVYRVVNDDGSSGSEAAGSGGPELTRVELVTDAGEPIEAALAGPDRLWIVLAERLVECDAAGRRLRSWTLPSHNGPDDAPRALLATGRGRLWVGLPGLGLIGYVETE